MMDPLEEAGIKRHDRFQFEVKLGHDLDTSRSTGRYRVETYFFLPNNLRINEVTYSKKDFYRDLLLYLRFKTPSFPLSALADREYFSSPLTALEEKIKKCGEKPSLEGSAEIEYEIRLVGCVMKSTLRDAVTFIHGRARLAFQGHGGSRPPLGFSMIDDFLQGLRNTISRFRKTGESIRGCAVPHAEHLRSTFAYTDEYVSLQIEWRAQQVLEILEAEERKALEGGEEKNAGEIRRLIGSVTTLVEEELAYRRAVGYPSTISAETDNELFMYRLGVLKKFVTSALHLSVRTVEEAKGLRELGLALGAGVAMIFATSVAFYYQQAYGTLSLTFFTALIVSYMLKDRLKAMSQEWLQKVFAHTLFDQTTDIFEPASGIKIGRCRESVQFVGEERIDPEVVRLRDRAHITEIENDFRAERLIYYVKEIRLFTRRLLSLDPRKSGLTDIVRFDVRNLLRRMDEPDASLLMLHNGRPREVPASRVYHVNLVIKLISGEGKETRYTRIRLVLDQSGIKRIEPVAGFFQPPT